MDLITVVMLPGVLVCAAQRPMQHMVTWWLVRYCERNNLIHMPKIDQGTTVSMGVTALTCSVYCILLVLCAVASAEVESALAVHQELVSFEYSVVGLVAGWFVVVAMASFIRMRRTLRDQEFRQRQ